MAECLRHFLLELERALAPAGELRAITKVAEVAAGRLEAVLWHLLMAVILALATVVVGAMLWVALLKLVRGRR